MRSPFKPFGGGGTSRPKRSYLHKVVRLKWRDSFQDDGLDTLKDLGDDCIWESFGAVIRESDLFITIAFHRELTNPRGYGDVLSVPWTQVINVKVLDAVEASSSAIKQKRKIHPLTRRAPEIAPGSRSDETDGSIRPYARDR